MSDDLQRGAGRLHQEEEKYREEVGHKRRRGEEEMRSGVGGHGLPPVGLMDPH